MKKISLIFAAMINFALASNILQTSKYIEFSELSQTLNFTISQNEILQCNPAIKGIYENTSTKKENSMRFYMQEPLRAGIKYKCVFNQENIEFNSINFSVNDFRLLRNGLVVLEFNDFVSKDEIEKNLQIYTNQNLSKNDIKFSIITDDEKRFFIQYSANDTTIKLDKISSKFGVNLDKEYILNTSLTPFNDNENAANINEIKASGSSYDDGNLGIRVYLPNYITASAKYIKIDGITNFNVSSPTYIDYDERTRQNLGEFYYYIDIKSEEFKANSEYKITLLPGFGDEYNLLRKEITQSIKTGDRKPFIAFSDDKKYIPKNATLNFKTANLSDVNIIVSKIQDINFRYFLNFDQNGEEKLSSEILNKKFDVGGEKNIVKEYKIDTDFKNFSDGVYNIVAIYKVDEEIKTVNKIVYLSDIGLSATLSDDEILILASRLSDGKILPGANIKIYNDKNELLHEGKSDKNGVLKFKQNGILKKNITSATASFNDEIGFLLLNDETKISSSEKTTSNYIAGIYLASELISPNEAILGDVLIKKYDFNALKNMPVKIEIYDPKNIKIVSKSLKTDEFGSVKINEQIGENTGFYRLNVVFENKILASKNFSVENFIPNRIKNEILLAKDEYFKDELLIANLSSNYLLGAIGANLNGSIEVNMFEKELKMKGYEGFSFSNEKLKKHTAQMVFREEFLLDENGKKDIIIAPQDNNISSAYDILINFSVIEDGKNVSAYKNVSYFPYKNVVGIASNKNFIKNGENVDFSLAILDSHTKKDNNTSIDIEIYRDDFRYFFDGERYVEQEEFSLVETFKTNSKNFTYKFNDAGNYLIVANDYLGGASASVRIDVSGYGYFGRLDPKDAKSAKIILEKDEFSPGEIIKGTVNSPIENGVLNISLIGSEILDFAVLDVKNFASSFELKVPQNFSGGHINAAIFRPSTKSTSPLRTYANLAVKLNNKTHKQNITLTHEKILNNAQIAEISVKSKPNSKVFLYAVDEGVLDIIEQEELNAFKIFDLYRYFNTSYHDIFNDISTYFSDAKALSFGGDSNRMYMAMAKREMSPVENKKEKNFIISQSGFTDANGIAKFNLKFPNNFNSKIRLSAISSDENSIGSANSYMQIKDDVVIKPAQISYLVKGDEIELPLTIINTTNTQKTLKLTTEISNNVKISNLNENVTLKPLEVVHLKATTKALIFGDAYVEFHLNSENEHFKNRLEFNIISAYPKSKFYRVSYGANTLEYEFDESYKDVFINVSKAPNGFNLAKELDLYPYGCTEQLASKAVGLDYVYQKDKNETIKQDLLKATRTILSRLKDNGEFGYWSEYSKTDGFASIYASDIMLDLDEKYDFMGENARYLILNRLKNVKENNFLRIYADFILNRHNKLSKDEINFIFDNKIYHTNLPSLYMAAVIFKTNGMEDEFWHIYKTIEKWDINSPYNFNELGQSHPFIPEFFESSIRNAAFALYAHATALDENGYSKKLVDFLIQNLQNTNSTQERAFIIRAFDTYFKTSDNSLNFKLIYDDKDRLINSEIFEKLSLKSPKIAFIPQNTDGAFYSVLSYGYEKLPLKHALKTLPKFQWQNSQTKALSLKRDFVNDKGEVIDLNNLKVGDKIYSKVQVKSNFYAQNLAIDEQIPACFEAVNERLSKTNMRSKAVKDNVKFENKEYLLDRILAFPEPFSDQEIVYFTPLNVVISGKCVIPAVKIEFMQDERISDYDLSGENFTISK